MNDKHPLIAVSIILLLVSLSLHVFIHYVNLAIKVDQNFFFSSDDPQLQSERKISRLFERKDSQLILSASGDVFSKEYEDNIASLTKILLSIPGISSVKSITNGPGSAKAADRSPLWRRLLISEDQNLTNLIIIIDEKRSSDIIFDIENIIHRESRDGFTLHLSGLPYVVKLIKDNLIHDIKVFFILAMLIFGFFIICIFRSYYILLGATIACICACIWSLILIDILNIKIGLLTANLATITLVMTLSHIVFLTYNWKHLLPKSRSIDSVTAALKITFPASFWSMITTLVGFLSLLFVPAKLLQELGSAGSVASLIAIMASYAIYPAFLRMVHISNVRKDKVHIVEKKLYSFFDRKKNVLVLSVITLLFLAVPGLQKMNVDPSLISYFSSSSNITQGLKYIDLNGGSSPLILVVQNESGDKLHNNDSYERMWNLQEDLESHEAIGTSISLPVLMSEAKKAPLSVFVGWNWLISTMEKEEYDEVARSFITKDRMSGLYFLRMKELKREKPRLEIVEEIKSIASKHGFVPDPIGGIFVIQGYLAELVTTSLVTGLGQLIIIFAIISLLISRSIRTMMAITLTVTIIPLSTLGILGLSNVPLDVISAPASNIAIAMGIDAMIHLVSALKRQNKNRKNKLHNWKRVIVRLRHPILTTTAITCSGFFIFLFSSFPPTQRFGMAIILGTLTSAVTALYIMPLFDEQFYLMTAKKES